MYITMPVGNSSFKAIKNNRQYYVDKTKFIAELLDRKVVVSLVTRPRRFGKTMMLSTLEEFFNIRNDKEDNRRLFEGLAIMEREDLVEEYMSGYPVMHFSFNGVAGATYKDLMSSIFIKMQEWCTDNRRIFNFDECDEDDFKIFKRIKEGDPHPDYKDPDNGKDLKMSDMQRFLSVMIRMLRDSYDKTVIVLIDEYDVPLAKASLLKGWVKVDNEAISSYDAIKQFIANLFGSALKDNEKYVKLTVVTGCMRIAQASIFTGINNFSWYGIQRSEYSDAFGFTPMEVDRILNDAGMPEKRQDFREWYDGYIFGDSEIYCPWDVLEQVNHLQGNLKARMISHWLGSSDNKILREMLDNPGMDVEEEVSALLAGGSVTASLDDNVTYDYLHGSKDNLWTVLYQTGYLTKESPEENGSMVRLVIPNKEVRKAYEKMFIEWKIRRCDTTQSGKIIAALLSRNAKEAERLLSQHLFESMSYFNYDEDFYHAFIGAFLKTGGYQLETDREYGLGRPDILLHNSISTKAITMEVKHAKKKEDYAGKLKEAVQQCIDKKYHDGVKAKFQNVVCYGIACFGKECMVREVVMPRDHES